MIIMNNTSSLYDFSTLINIQWLQPIPGGIFREEIVQRLYTKLNQSWCCRFFFPFFFFSFFFRFLNFPPTAPSWIRPWLWSGSAHSVLQNRICWQVEHIGYNLNIFCSLSSFKCHVTSCGATLKCFVLLVVTLSSVRSHLTFYSLLTFNCHVTCCGATLKCFVLLVVTLSSVRSHLIFYSLLTFNCHVTCCGATFKCFVLLFLTLSSARSHFFTLKYHEIMVTLSITM